MIRYDNTLLDKLGDIYHSHVACEVRPEKDDRNRTHIIVVGGNMFYPGEVTTPTGSLKLIKLMFNSVLSQPGAHFAWFEIKNFNLNTPLEDPEYMRIKLTDIPEEFIDEYGLTEYVQHR